MKNYKKIVGKFGEDVAVKYLQDKDYKILDRNVHFRCGEIDIIAEKDGILYFVEVKTRTSTAFGDLEDAVSDTKVQRFENAVENYFIENNFGGDFELLFVLIFVDTKNLKTRVQIFNVGR